jgi:hypothetical protein
MNILLWVLQVLAALLYGSSGVMKVFMFDKVSQDVPSFGALPREAWMTLGIRGPLAGRISHPLAPGVGRLCPREDQMPVVRRSVCIQIPPVGPEDLPELWI